MSRVRRSRCWIGGGLLAVLAVFVLMRHIAPPSTTQRHDPETPGEGGPRLHGALREQSGVGRPEPPHRIEAQPVVLRDGVVADGTVIDENGAHVGGGRVVLLDRTALRVFCPVSDDGRFELRNPALLGRVRIGYLGPTHFSALTGITIGRGRSMRLVARALLSLDVTVIGEQGDAVEGCAVSTQLWKFRPGDERAVTDADGRCRIRVSPDPRNVMAQAPDGRWDYRPVDPRQTSATTVVLKRRFTVVPVSVRAAPGSEHLEGSTVRLVPCHARGLKIAHVDAVVGGAIVHVPVKVVRIGAMKITGPVFARVGAAEPYETGLKPADHGVAVTLLVEARDRHVELDLVDTAGNPLRGLPFTLTRTDVRLRDATQSPPPLKLRSDADGRAIFSCAAGSYRGPGGVVDLSQGGRHRMVVDGFAALHGTVEPPVGNVRIVGAGRDGDASTTLLREEVEVLDGRWWVSVPVKPGTRVVVELMEWFAPVARAEAEAGGEEVTLRYQALLDDPHESTLEVRRDGAIVPAMLRLSTPQRVRPRVISRTYQGQRVFDLFSLPVGTYVVEECIVDGLDYHFDREIHIDGTRHVRLDLEEAPAVWDIRRGRYVRGP